MPGSVLLDDHETLTQEEILRYSRHLVIEDVALAGQQRLKHARVLVIGLGGLGSPLALYLAAAGVGHLGLVDFDVVDMTNLQRQVLHGSKDLGRPKLDSAIERLRDLNSHVHLERYDTRLTAANAREIVPGYDVVVDGTDNFATRYLTNDCCVQLGIPNVYGSIHRFEGQASIFATIDGPCYRCLFPEPPPPGLVPSCAEGGVLGVLPGLIGTIQATETLKLILGIGDTLAGRLLLIDALQMRMRTMKVRKNPECPACGTRQLTALIDYDAFCGVVREQPSANDDNPELTPGEVAARLKNGPPVYLIDVREPAEWAIARIEQAQLIPLSVLPDALATVPRDQDVVVLCKSGARSTRAAKLLRNAGVPRVWNLAGGIARWSSDVDPEVPRY